MALFLDSARLEDARKAQSIRIIEGITTNPLRLKETGHPPLEALEELVDHFDGHVFYQLTAPTIDGRIDEAWQAYDLRPDRVIVKVTATTENLSILKRVPEIEVAVTMVYSPLQAYAAAAAGATYIMPYINRGIKHYGDGLSTNISQMRDLLRNFPTEILAANIESHEQALQALVAGADHVTMPLPLLMSLGNHPLTQQTIEEYNEG